jgi:hypothetical protein
MKHSEAAITAGKKSTTSILVSVGKQKMILSGFSTFPN